MEAVKDKTVTLKETVNEVTLTVPELIDLDNAVETLSSSQQNFNFKVFYALSKSKKVLKEERETIAEREREIIKKYDEFRLKDKDGKYITEKVTLPDGSIREIAYPKETIKNINEELEENKKNTVTVKLHKIPKEYFGDINLRAIPGILSIFEYMIIDN